MSLQRHMTHTPRPINRGGEVRSSQTRLPQSGGKNGEVGRSGGEVSEMSKEQIHQAAFEAG